MIPALNLNRIKRHQAVDDDDVDSPPPMAQTLGPNAVRAATGGSGADDSSDPSSPGSAPHARAGSGEDSRGGRKSAVDALVITGRTDGSSIMLDSYREEYYDQFGTPHHQQHHQHHFSHHGYGSSPPPSGPHHERERSGVDSCDDFGYTVGSSMGGSQVIPPHQILQDEVNRFMAFNPQESEDLEEMREKLVTAQKLFLSLEKRYEDELLRKERHLGQELERLLGGGGNIWNPQVSPVGLPRSSGRHHGGVANKGVQAGSVGGTPYTPVNSARSAGGFGTPRSSRVGETALASGRSVGSISETNSSRLRRQMLANRAEGYSNNYYSGITHTANTARSPGQTHFTPTLTSSSVTGNGQHTPRSGQYRGSTAYTARAATGHQQFFSGNVKHGTNVVGRNLSANYVPTSTTPGKGHATPTPTNFRDAGSGLTPRGGGATSATPRPYTPAQRRTPIGSARQGATTPRGGASTPRR